MHIDLFGPNLLQWNFIEIFPLCEVVRTNFFAGFCRVVAIFRPQFRENCSATYRRKLEFSSASERAISSEKKLKTAPRPPITRDTIPDQIMSPSNKQRAELRASQREKQTQYFGTYRRRVLLDLPQTLHGGRTRCANSKRCWVVTL